MDPERSFRPPDQGGPLPPSAMPYGEAPSGPAYGSAPAYGTPPGYAPPPPPYGAPSPSRRPPASFGRRPSLPPLDIVEDYPRRPGRSAFWDVVRNRRTITRSRPGSVGLWGLLVVLWVGSAVVFGQFSTADGDPTNALGGMAITVFLLTSLLGIVRLFRLLLRIGRRLRMRRVVRRSTLPPSFTGDPFGR